MHIPSDPAAPSPPVIGTGPGRPEQATTASRDMRIRPRLHLIAHYQPHASPGGGAIISAHLSPSPAMGTYTDPPAGIGAGGMSPREGLRPQRSHRGACALSIMSTNGVRATELDHPGVARGKNKYDRLLGPISQYEGATLGHWRPLALFQHAPSFENHHYKAYQPPPCPEARLCEGSMAYQGARGTLPRHPTYVGAAGVDTTCMQLYSAARPRTYARIPTSVSLSHLPGQDT
jgi:hypothetical protein